MTLYNWNNSKACELVIHSEAGELIVILNKRKKERKLAFVSGN